MKTFDSFRIFAPKQTKEKKGKPLYTPVFLYKSGVKGGKHNTDIMSYRDGDAFTNK